MRVAVLGVVTVIAIAGCDGRYDAIGLRNGTDRVLTVVEVYDGRDIDGGRLEPESYFMFDSFRGSTGVIEIRDDGGNLLSIIDGVWYCSDDPVFVITEAFLEVREWHSVDNCRAEPGFAKEP